MTIKLMLPIDLQETNERRYVRKHIDAYLLELIQKEHSDKVAQGVYLLGEWLSQDYYLSKNIRLEYVKEMDLRALVEGLLSQLISLQVAETFVSVTAQLAHFIGFDDKEDSIRTVAEIVAVLCNTDVYDIYKDSPESSLMVVSNVKLPVQLANTISRSKYPIPMVCEPRTITSNFESPYLTFNECQILGKGNAHNEDICLDVINTQNKVALKLDLTFLCTVEEEPNHALDSVDKYRDWMNFKRESYETYELLARQGNHFYLTNRVDKRGRLYSQGYHVNVQGAPFKKAMIELVHEEVVEGVPYEYRL